jgi:nicotinamidase-related amidase
LIGSGAYEKSKGQFEKWFERIASHGGNAVRVWVLVDGQNAPKFDSEGFATGEDTKSLITEIGEYLDSAAKHNIFVILCLWNGAVKPHQQVLDMFSHDDKLERFIEKVLSPLVSGLKDKKALAAWEVINEVGGSVTQDIHDENKCFDTQKLHNSGADWAKSDITMKNALKFINRHIDAIKTADPKVLTTSGAWSERPNLDVCDYCFNYYKDECLIAAGTKTKGVLGKYYFIGS